MSGDFSWNILADGMLDLMVSYPSAELAWSCSHDGVRVIYRMNARVARPLRPNLRSGTPSPLSHFSAKASHKSSLDSRHKGTDFTS